MSSQFYVLSLKRTLHEAAWWMPNEAGYTRDLNRAGKYSHAIIEANRQRLDNGETTRAIPCDLAHKVSRRVVSAEDAAKLIQGK